MRPFGSKRKKPLRISPLRSFVSNSESLAISVSPKFIGSNNFQKENRLLDCSLNDHRESKASQKMSIFEKKSTEIEGHQKLNTSILNQLKRIGQRKKEAALQKGFDNFFAYSKHETIFGDSPTMIGPFEKVKCGLPKEKYKEYPESLVSSSKKRGLLQKLSIDTGFQIFKENPRKPIINDPKKRFGFVTEANNVKRVKSEDAQRNEMQSNKVKNQIFFTLKRPLNVRIFKL